MISVMDKWDKIHAPSKTAKELNYDNIKCSEGIFDIENFFSDYKREYTDPAKLNYLMVELERKTFESPLEFIAYCRLLKEFVGQDLRFHPQEIILTNHEWVLVENLPAGHEEVYEVNPISYRKIDIGINVFPWLENLFWGTNSVFLPLPKKEKIKSHDLYRDLYREAFVGIEIDGYQFHNGEDKKRFQEQIERERELKDLGYEIIRFAGTEIYDLNNDNFEKTVKKAIQKKQKDFLKRYVKF